MTIRSLILFAFACLAVMPAILTASDDIDIFVAELELLAQEHRLPGLSGAVLREGDVLWSGGFGFADLETEVPATADTPYRLASVTKPFAAVVLLQLVQERRLDLDARMSDFPIHAWFEPGGGSWAHYPERYDRNPITVRHVLTHTSQSDPPGDAYRYSGNIFADLTWVIEAITGMSYPDVVAKRILQPLGMQNAAAGQLVPAAKDIVQRLATPYDVSKGEPRRATYPGFGLDAGVDATRWKLDPAYRLPAPSQAARRQVLGSAFTPLYSAQAAAGMIASVDDLVRFDRALDTRELLDDARMQEMWTASRNAKGESLPYGLGWFVEDIDGTKVVWHYGWFPPVVSALWVKVPERRLTLILLTNCDGLSAGVAWTAEGVRGSAFARSFLEQLANAGR